MALGKGGNLELPADLEVGGFLDVSLRVSDAADPVPDVFVVVADQSGKALGEDSIVFFNNPTDSSGAVTLLTDAGRIGARIRLNRLPAQASSVFVAVNAEGPISTLNGVVCAHDGSGSLITEFSLSGLSSEDTVVLAEVYRRLGHWRLRAVSQGWSQGVAALLSSYGVVVDDDPSVTGPAVTSGSQMPVPPLPQVPNQRSAQPAVSAPGRAGVGVPPPPTPTAQFCPPPGWPPPPVGWRPPVGWQPDSRWPAAPAGWDFWSSGAPSAPGQGGGSVPAPPQFVPTSTVASPAPSVRTGLFGPRRSDLQAEVNRLTSLLNQVGAMDLAHVQAVIAERVEELRLMEGQVVTARAELAQLQTQLVITEADVQAQEAGFFIFTHPLDDSAAYKGRLAELRDEMKKMIRDGQAITAIQQWTVNGSVREGTAMVRDFSKLMLRAYNSEADNAVRTVKPHTRRTAQDRLTKAQETIARLGKTMSIRVGDHYHNLRSQEIALTAEYLAKVAEERERARAAREEQREAEKVERELQRERERLERERSHYQTALGRASWGLDDPRTRELQAKLDEIGDAIVGIEHREANIRAGYVYVISNVGAFGERMVKIGMTRRLEPLDRVRELGGASVPFRFDVHALIFSHDAVSLENSLHRAFEDRKVNAVNPRREFFYATPQQVRDALGALGSQYLLEFVEEPEAEEFRRSPQPLATTGVTPTGY